MSHKSKICTFEFLTPPSPSDNLKMLHFDVILRRIECLVAELWEISTENTLKIRQKNQASKWYSFVTKRKFTIDAAAHINYCALWMKQAIIYLQAFQLIFFHLSNIFNYPLVIFVNYSLALVIGSWKCITMIKDTGLSDTYCSRKKPFSYYWKMAV